MDNEFPITIYSHIRPGTKVTAGLTTGRVDGSSVTLNVSGHNTDLHLFVPTTELPRLIEALKNALTEATA
jgi:hypothetical protein